MTATNEQRAHFAGVALEAYSQHIYKLSLDDIRKHNISDLKELCQDLIIDITHFANRNGIDVKSMAASAKRNYEDELKS